MFENIIKDLNANNSHINHAGFRVLLVYRFGCWRMKIRYRIIRAPLSYVYRQAEKHVRFKYGIELPYTAQLGEGVRFEHQHGIVIHGSSKIGDNCIIRQGVTIGNKNAVFPNDSPCIGNNVNIGAGAKILGKVIIGDFVTIGANSVVIKDVPDFAVVAGIPAKIIGWNRT